MPRATLTRKQARFVELYLAGGGNAAEAYRQAYSSAAPSRSVAREGHRLLKHPKIVPFLAAAEAKARAAQVDAANRYAVSRERNVAELARMAYANIEDYTRQVGEERLIDLSGATRDQLAALQEITVEDYLDGRGKDARQVRRTKIKLGDKQGAIERLNKMFGWVVDKSEVGQPGDFAKMTDEQLDAEMVVYLVDLGISEPQARALLEAKRNAREPTQ
jgi:phage terminase small subunit